MQETLSAPRVALVPGILRYHSCVLGPRGSITSQAGTEAKRQGRKDKESHWLSSECTESLNKGNALMPEDINTRATKHGAVCKNTWRVKAYRVKMHPQRNLKISRPGPKNVGICPKVEKNRVIFSKAITIFSIYYSLPYIKLHYS